MLFAELAADKVESLAPTAGLSGTCAGFIHQYCYAIEGTYGSSLPMEPKRYRGRGNVHPVTERACSDPQTRTLLAGRARFCRVFADCALFFSTRPPTARGGMGTWASSWFGSSVLRWTHDAGRPFPFP